MIRREVGVFLVVGVLTVCVDFLTYRTLSWTAWFGTDVAKAVGFLTGTLFAYFANRHWTFGARHHSPGAPVRFAALYLLTLGANVIVNAAILGELSATAAAIQVAFLCATGVSATINFFGMKFFVFRPSTSPKMP